MLQKILQFSTDLFISWEKGISFFHNMVFIEVMRSSVRTFDPIMRNARKNQMNGLRRKYRWWWFYLHRPVGAQTELSKILIAIFSIIVFNPFGEEEKAGRDYVAMDWRGWGRRSPCWACRSPLCLTSTLVQHYAKLPMNFWLKITWELLCFRPT